MTQEHYLAANTYLGIAKNGSSFRRSDAKYTSADIHSSDILIDAFLTEPIGIAAPVANSGSYLQKWRTTQYLPGSLIENYWLQTGRLLYPFYGPDRTTAITTEATPNVHALTIRTSQTPVYCGRHLERENETDAESERIDIFGMLPQNLHMECAEISPVATQSATWITCKTLTTGTDDIAKPTAISEDAFEWTQFTFPTFTYSGETLEADIIGWGFDIQNNVRVHSLDSGGCWIKGKMNHYAVLSVTLDIIPYGKNAFELIRTSLDGYHVDGLDLTVKMARNATTDYIQFTHNNLYCQPFSIKAVSIGEWYEGYRMQMHQLSSGSLAIEIKDAYNNDYYENP